MLWREHDVKHSLISRFWCYPILWAFIAYTLVQLGFSIDLWHNTTNAACAAPKFSKWTWYANFVEMVAFCATGFIQICRSFLTNKISRDFGCNVVICAIIFFAGLSSTINLLTNWSGICEDSLGVRLPGTMLAEWIASVPLLFYIVLATENKAELSKIEKNVLLLVIVTFLLKILSQLCNIVDISASLILASAISYTIASCLFYYVTFYKYQNDLSRIDCLSTPINSYASCLRKTQIQLASCLLIILPFFPLVYLLSYCRLLDHDMTYVLTVSLNIFAKFMFISIIDSSSIRLTSDFANIDLSAQQMSLRTEIEANEARRLFVRYIMHEVRVPLNSITMGLGYLRQDPLLDDEAKEALLMMDGATGFMKQTLNDVLNMQRIEDGKLELDYVPFSIEAVIKRVKASLQGSLTEKRIRLIINIARSVPAQMLGDGFRVEHVLVNLLSNALKFSTYGSDIIVEVRPESNSNFKLLKFQSVTNLSNSILKKTDNKVRILFSVTDHGQGIAEADLSALFTPFSQIRPHELQSGGGSGIGLVICKQIVELHGGTITCQSKLGVGSTFFFTIPFDISNNNNSNNNNSNDNNELENGHCLDVHIMDVLPDLTSKSDNADLGSASCSGSVHGSLVPFQLSSRVQLPSFRLFDKTNEYKTCDTGNTYETLRQCTASTILSSKNSYMCTDSNKIDNNNKISNNINENNITENNFPFKCVNRNESDSSSLPYVNVTPSTTVATSSDLQGRYHSTSMKSNKVVVESPDLSVPSSPNPSGGLNAALVVDDVLSNRKLLALNLKRLGIECTTAVHGREALELVQNQLTRFEVIFMDSSMPILNGVEATKEIRAAGFTRLVIGVTGNALADDVAEFIAAGADSVIPKPISLQEIHQIIHYVGVHGSLHRERRRVVFSDTNFEILEM